MNKLPKGWELKRLGDVATFINGRAFKPSEWGTSGYPIIRIQNLTSQDSKFNYYNSEPEEKYFVIAGDLLVSWSATLGAFIWNGKKSALNQHIFKVVVNQKIIDKTYLFYVIQTKIDEMKLRVHGSTMTHITKKDFDRIEIPVPPFPVQKKIVSILEKAERLKQRRRKANEETNNVIQSVFYEMFGDYLKDKKSFKKIEDFVSKNKNAIKAGPFGSSLKKKCYVKKGYKIYGQEQVIKDDLTFGDYYISEKKYNELENYKVQEGDILISLVGTYGKISIIPKRFQHGIINPRLMKITLDKNKMSPIFFKSLFLSNMILTELKNVSHGGTMNIVNVGIIKKMGFPSPPIELQNKFAEYVKRTEKIKQHQKNSEQDINTLFDALMQKAFHGELVR